MGAILLFGMLAFVNFRIRNNPFLVHVCACMFMAFYLGWVFLQPSEKEAFRNGRVQEIQKLNEELAASQENFRSTSRRSKIPVSICWDLSMTFWI